MTTHVLKKSQGKEQPLLVCEIIREVGIVKNPNAFESVVLNGGHGVFSDPLRSSGIRGHHGHLVSTADKTTSEFIRHARCAAILESGIEIRNNESNAHADPRPQHSTIRSAGLLRSPALGSAAVGVIYGSYSHDFRSR